METENITVLDEWHTTGCSWLQYENGTKAKYSTGKQQEEKVEENTTLQYSLPMYWYAEIKTTECISPYSYMHCTAQQSCTVFWSDVGVSPSWLHSLLLVVG